MPGRPRLAAVAGEWATSSGGGWAIPGGGFVAMLAGGARQTATTLGGGCVRALVLTAVVSLAPQRSETLVQSLLRCPETGHHSFMTKEKRSIECCFERVECTGLLKCKCGGYWPREFGLPGDVVPVWCRSCALEWPGCVRISSPVSVSSRRSRVRSKSCAEAACAQSLMSKCGLSHHVLWQAYTKQ
jgi:hypothetical protein